MLQFGKAGLQGRGQKQHIGIDTAHSQWILGLAILIGANEHSNRCRKKLHPKLYCLRDAVDHAHAFQ